MSRTQLRPEIARAHLLYGEWLRRENRRIDARSQLRAAYDQFTSIGMGAFAERSRRELTATGETLRKRTIETRDELTGQERQVALFARDGMSNSEIGARLFLSQHTVAYHLRKVFSKLGSAHAENWPPRCRGPNPSRSPRDPKRSPQPFGLVNCIAP